MIPAAFEYERATSVDDAIARLKAAGGAGKLIAGGHSLVPLMKLRLSQPAVLIDLAHIPDFAGVREADRGGIIIGAGTTHHDVATSPLLRERCPAVADTAAVIGDPQVRNRGTIGGSLAHADPAADYPATMLALDASLRVAGPNGMRVVRADDFSQGMFTVDLAADEILTAVTFEPVRRAAYAKLPQRASRFAIVGVAAALEVEDGVVVSARVAVTGAAGSPSRLEGVERALAGRPATIEAMTAAATGAGVGLTDLNEDIHASAGYRRAMVEVFTRRALTAALARSDAV
ncbi:MAG: xanthine dehydrogenase family protein subunit M [Acidobacteria bacterium]|nr:xanthine dehydrogenase family protein subunit M [Acidobacteriota bacterium]MYJ04070.1 xanthine dehydrogenase family protein subunit M [Acidobacteriota bacterium]